MASYDLTVYLCISHITHVINIKWVKVEWQITLCFVSVSVFPKSSHSTTYWNQLLTRKCWNNRGKRFVPIKKSWILDIDYKSDYVKFYSVANNMQSVNEILLVHCEHCQIVRWRESERKGSYMTNDNHAPSKQSSGSSSCLTTFSSSIDLLSQPYHITATHHFLSATFSLFLDLVFFYQ